MTKESETTDHVPPAIAWKRDYLALIDTIEEFQKRRLEGVADFRPPADDPSRGNVGRLLVHHLDRCRELLCAEVNGGLDEHYQEMLPQPLNNIVPASDDDLVQRLDREFWQDGFNAGDVAKICLEAADRIRRADAAIMRLTIRVNELRGELVDAEARGQESLKVSGK